MLENRRHYRLREFIDVAWNVVDQDVAGDGLVLNISASGVLLQTDRVFRPSDNCILSIQTSAQPLPFSPKRGKMMWFKRFNAPKERFICGIQFLPDTIDYKFQEWFQEKVNKISEAGDSNILGNMAF